MRMPMNIRVLSVLVGLAFILAPLWRPLLGLTALTGPSAWVCFAVGVIVILAGIYGGAGHYENSTTKSKV